ncbi:MAG: hypothetical protein LKI94_08875 [Sporolactobacillus sp.]|jgi:hypothetical protein|nr:hypothetical protein [Sporolactobacillus sp.]MCI1882289.1 hypothetical protein [Sporolactobacillus sp.]
MDDFIQLDKTDFAKLVVMSMPGSKSTDPEKIAKEKLTLFLVAYVLAGKFNELELQYSTKGKKGKNFSEFLSRLNTLGILAFEEDKGNKQK